MLGMAAPGNAGPKPGVSAFGRFWSGGSSLFRTWNGPTTTGGEDRFQPKSLPLTYIRRTMEQRWRPVSTYDIQPKHGLCADVICGDSGYLRTTFHLQFPTFLHSICAAATSEPLISIKL